MLSIIRKKGTIICTLGAILVLCALIFTCKSPSGGPGQTVTTANSISINKTSLNLLQGGNTETLIATTDPPGAAITWSSSDPKIAVVNSKGRVFPLIKTGTITITASSGSKSATCTVTVTDDGYMRTVNGNAGYSFLMGATSSEPGNNDQRPQHWIIVSTFYMGKYQVTQALFEAVMGNNPSAVDSTYPTDPGETAEMRPVEYANWFDAIIFCNKLSRLEGLSEVYTVSGSPNPANWGNVPVTIGGGGAYNGVPFWTVSADFTKNGYRLPTEAEWEYACREEGSQIDLYFYGPSANGSYMWYDSNSGGLTHAVGKTTPNSLGLFDMYGNVMEWCWDWQADDYYELYGATPGPPYPDWTTSAPNPKGPATGTRRVLRGGHAWNDGNGISSARKGSYDPSIRYHDAGFRIVRTTL